MNGRDYGPTFDQLDPDRIDASASLTVSPPMTFTYTAVRPHRRLLSLNLLASVLSQNGTHCGLETVNSNSDTFFRELPCMLNPANGLELLLVGNGVTV